MNKKIKLFSTIASLCLAVCLMAFGVWAAASSTMTVSSTISYSVSGNVHVKFDVAVDFEHTKVTRTPAVDASDVVTTNQDKTTFTKTISPSDSVGDFSVNLGTYAFVVGAENNPTVKFTVTITNLAKYGAQVTASALPTNNSKNGGITATTTASNGKTVLVATTASTGTKSVTYEVTYTLTDNATDGTINFAPSFKVEPNTAG